jgi:hypothetical protein
MTAEVHVPSTGDVKESGVDAANAEGVKFLRAEAGARVYEIDGGNYAFTFDAK